MIGINISECDDINAVVNLFNSHKDEPFTYLADIQLFKIFTNLDQCKLFIAKYKKIPVGCIYVMQYMYDYGWIGGLLVDKRFRGQGISRKLLERGLTYLTKMSHNYLFVDPKNSIAKKLFENMGFNIIYRRHNYVINTSAIKRNNKEFNMSYEVGWEELTDALGFKERGNIVNLGYYPIKITKEIFNELKRRKHVLKYGDIIAIIENSYVVVSDGYTFIFNDYILEKTTLVSIKKKLIEINPFYAKPNISDFIELLKHLLTYGDITIWTYEGDPVTNKLPLRGHLGVLVMERHS